MEYGLDPLTRYSANLIVPDEARYEVTALKALAARFVMNRTGVDAIYAHQRQQISDLVSAISDNPIARLDPLHRDLWLAAQSDTEKARCVIDQVASLTDVSVVQWHTTLCA
jgi:dGTPase